MERGSRFGRWTWAFALLCVPGCTSVADSAAPQGAKDGIWWGPDLQFRVVAGMVQDVRLTATMCSGDDGNASYGGAVEGVVQAAGSWQLGPDDLRVEGQFATPIAASGVMRLGGDDAPCRVVAVWTADWQGAEPVGGGGGEAGSVDWGGASTGSLHPGPSLAAPAARTAPAALGEQRLAALTRLDQVRASCGTPAIAGDDAAHAAAQAHAEFYVQHAAAYKAAGLSPHGEDASFGAGFVADSFGERMKKAGFTGSPASEVMAFTGSGVAAVDGWMETLYHRLPLIDPGMVLVGVGVAKVGKDATEVMDFGAGHATSAPSCVVWPWPGQADVPTSWSGNEGPQPQPPPQGYPSGPVITAHLPAGSSVTAHKLLDASGAEIAHVWRDASNDANLKGFDARAVALYAHAPLAADSSYTVHLALRVGAKDETLIWRFRTGP